MPEVKDKLKKAMSNHGENVISNDIDWMPRSSYAWSQHSVSSGRYANELQLLKIIWIGF